MKGLIENPIVYFSSIFSSLWGHLCSSEGVSTLLVALIIYLKLYVNNTATTLQKKSLVVSFPSELTVLIMGFLISATISNTPDKNHIALIVLVIISLLLLVHLYASERYLENQLSGSWSWKIWGRVILMYIFSISLYITVVLGGVI